MPAKFQGTRIGGTGIDKLEIESLTRSDISRASQREQFELLQQLNQTQISRRNVRNSEFDALVDSYDLAWRMQSIAPEILNIENESQATLNLYGIDDPATRGYGQKCLLARRLCESGVRFIQVNYGDNSANPAWDQHSNLPKHADHARAVDRPIAGFG